MLLHHFCRHRRHQHHPEQSRHSHRCWYHPHLIRRDQICCRGHRQPHRHQIHLTGLIARRRRSPSPAPPALSAPASSAHTRRDRRRRCHCHFDQSGRRCFRRCRRRHHQHHRHYRHRHRCRSATARQTFYPWHEISPRPEPAIWVVLAFLCVANERALQTTSLIEFGHRGSSSNAGTRYCQLTPGAVGTVSRASCIRNHLCHTSWMQVYH